MATKLNLAITDQTTGKASADDRLMAVVTLDPVVWVEGDAGYFLDLGKWADRLGGKYPLSTSLVGGLDPINVGAAANFSYQLGAASRVGQSIDLGTVFPSAGDWSFYALVRQTDQTWMHAIGGGSSGGWWGVYFDTSGHLSFTNAGAGAITSAIAHPAGSLRVISITYVRSGGHLKMYNDGVLELAQDSVGVLFNADVTIGAIPGFGGFSTFVGSIYSVSIFAAAHSDANRQAVEAYLLHKAAEGVDFSQEDDSGNLLFL